MNSKQTYYIIIAILIFLTGSSCLSCSGQLDETLETYDLRCHGFTEPKGIDDVYFSWKIKSDKQNILQSAYEIRIASSLDDLVNDRYIWESGKVKSTQQTYIYPDKAELSPGNDYYWKVRIWDNNGNYTQWSDPAAFSIAITSSDWHSKWITSVWNNDSGMPQFRKEFTVKNDDKKLKRATVYFCGLGYGDLYINGHLADSTRILDSAQTNYEQYALFSTLDITEYLNQGANCLGVVLGEGFYGQGSVWSPSMRYGDPMFRLQMEIMYSDGSKEIICSDESWTWHSSPILKANVYSGEVYDGTKEIPGWNIAGSELNDWQQAVEATGVIPKEMRPQMVEPVRIKDEISAKKIWKSPAGKWIIDFGENFAGIPYIKINEPIGTHIRMQMGEYLNPDSSINYESTGNFATGVIQTDEYICSGTGEEHWNPRFTYHGYRYLEISGIKDKPDFSSIKSLRIHTDVEKRGTFDCSNAQINKLHEIAIRTVLSNIHGLPTDCPHRERCGWLGDAHAVFPFENDNFDMENFWIKYMEDIYSTALREEKNTLFHKLKNRIFYFEDKPSGLPYMISPGRRLCGVASPDWGTAVIQLPWLSYIYYGNTKPMEKYYPMMRQWVDHIERISMNDTLPTKHIVPYGLGDWCPPGGNKAIDCPIALTSTAFHYLDASLMENMAAILGKEDDRIHYKILKEDIKSAFISTFYDDNNKSFGSQTANAMSLLLGLVPYGDEQKVSSNIVLDMDENCQGFMNTGIFGLGRIGQALSRYGNGKTAWNMFTKTGENSFAYMFDIANATTLWEILPINQESKNMCLNGKSSLNHPMQGVYDAWFYEDIAGIRPDIDGPGFKVIRFEPTMMSYLEWAKASINTPYGQTKSEWENNGGNYVWRILLPPNTTGIVALPSFSNIVINGKTMDNNVFKPISRKDSVTYYNFPSGKYEIEINNADN